MRRSVLVAALVLFSFSTLAQSQTPGQRGQRGQAPKPPSAPTPRYSDGHPMLSAPMGQLGYWDAGTGSLTGKRGVNLPTNIEISEVPFQPWAKALYEARLPEQYKSDPH